MTERTPRTSQRKRLIRDAAFLALLFGAGYGVTLYWVAPSDGIVADAGERTLPRVVELPEGEARERLEGLGLRVRVAPARPHARAPRGRVIWQDPAPGTVLAPGTSVEIVASAGPPSAPVPDVVGFPVWLASEVVRAAGFRVGKVDTLRAPGEPGVVIATQPGTGQPRSAGSEIGLVVSQPRTPPARAATAEPSPAPETTTAEPPSPWGFPFPEIPSREDEDS